MAAGDLVSVTIGAEGWYADIVMEGMGTGGTYAFGLGTNNDPATGTPKITFSVVSEGYDNTGTLGTIARTVYGTKEVRWPVATSSIAGVFTSGTFIDGETVTASISGRTAVVQGAQSAGAKLFVHTVSGSTNTADVWTGGTSGAIFTASATHSVLSANTPRERNDGTNTTVRIALSEFIYLDDNTGAGKSGIAPTVTILAGFYTSGGTPNAASGAGYAVTNNSTTTYPRPVANWSLPDRQVITGATFSPRCVAFERFAQGGVPVKCVVFTAFDGTNTVTQTVTEPTVESTLLGDATPVIEYIATMSSSTLDQGVEITVNFKAYPHVGDAPLDTADAVNSNPSANYAPQKWLNNKTGGLGGSEAFVDAATGTSGGSAVAIGTGDENSTPLFQTLYQAINAIILRNEAQYSRKSSDLSIVYCRDGTYAWIGAGSLPGSLVAQKSYLTIKKSPSATRANVILSGQAGASAVQQYIKFEDITLGNTATSMVAGHTLAWAHNCTWNQTTANRLVFNNNTIQYVTGSICTNHIEGFQPFGAVAAAYALIRGNDFTDYAGPAHFFNFIGNKRNKGAGSTQYFRLVSKSTTSTLLPQTPICAFNNIRWLTANGGNFTALYTTEADPPAGYVGTAMIQNLFEQCNASASPIIAIGADASDNSLPNVLIWNNTSLGQRNNNAYNDAGTTPWFRLNWSVKNNLVDNWNIKTDTFTTASAYRIGNFAEVYGVGNSGNLFAETLGTGAAGQFNKAFPGLRSIQGNGTAVDTYIAFTDRKASYNAGAGAGMGTYTLQFTSPAITLQRDWLLPYDLAGTARSVVDAVGAYHYGDAMASGSDTAKNTFDDRLHSGSYSLSDLTTFSGEAATHTFDITEKEKLNKEFRHWRNILSTPYFTGNYIASLFIMASGLRAILKTLF